jgi:hypothetical protein
MNQALLLLLKNLQQLLSGLLRRDAAAAADADAWCRSFLVGIGGRTVNC